MQTKVMFVTVLYPVALEPLTGEPSYLVGSEEPVNMDTPVEALGLMFPGNAGVECSADDVTTVWYDVPLCRVC